MSRSAIQRGAPVLRLIVSGLWLCVPAVSAAASELDAADLYELPAADVIFLGEIHDNPAHHAHQAIVVDVAGPGALVFEMLAPERAALVNGAHLGSEAALGSVLGWDSAGWPDFAMYYPIFVAGKAAAFFGGGGSPDEARRAVGEGAAAVFGDGADLFGLTEPLPVPEQVDREIHQMNAHCNAIPEDLAPGMVEAQRLRDAWLARAVVEASFTTEGPIIVITGNGHARKDWGVPPILARVAPDLSVLTIGQYETGAPYDPPFDHWLVTEPAPRPDPCAVFR